MTPKKTDLATVIKNSQGDLNTVARFFRVTVRTIYRWIDRYDLWAYLHDVRGE